MMHNSSFPVVGKCPQGWREILGSCYLFTSNSSYWLPWAAARSQCRMLQGDLAVMNSSDIQNAVAWTLKKTSVDRSSLFVGFLREKKWAWSDGSTFHDSWIWRAGFPSIREFESCAAITGSGLVDIRCGGRSQFICGQGEHRSVLFFSFCCGSATTGLFIVMVLIMTRKIAGR